MRGRAFLGQLIYLEIHFQVIWDEVFWPNFIFSSHPAGVWLLELGHASKLSKLRAKENKSFWIHRCCWMQNPLLPCLLVNTGELQTTLAKYHRHLQALKMTLFPNQMSNIAKHHHPYGHTEENWIEWLLRRYSKLCFENNCLEPEETSRKSLANVYLSAISLTTCYIYINNLASK